MSIRTPPSLSWLIDKRARLLGEINNIENYLPAIIEQSSIQMEKWKELLELRIKAHKEYIKSFARLTELKENLPAIDIALSLHNIKVDKNLISPIRP